MKFKNLVKLLLAGISVSCAISNANATTWVSDFTITSGGKAILLQGTQPNYCAAVPNPISISSYASIFTGGTVLNTYCGVITQAWASSNPNGGPGTAAKVSGSNPIWFALYQSVNTPTDYYMQPLVQGEVADDSLSNATYYPGVSNIWAVNAFNGPFSEACAGGNICMLYPGSWSGHMGEDGNPFQQENLFRNTCDLQTYQFITAGANSIRAQCAVMTINQPNEPNVLPLPSQPTWSSGYSMLSLDQLIPGVPVASDSSAGQLIQVWPGDYGNNQNRCNIDYWNGSEAQFTCAGPLNGASRSLYKEGVKQLNQVSFIVSLDSLTQGTMLPPGQVWFLHMTNDGNGNYNPTAVAVFASSTVSAKPKTK